ncbi:MAG: lytic transglycosylase domain-containing protein [Xanthobacteraceae bacterium]
MSRRLACILRAAAFAGAWMAGSSAAMTSDLRAIVTAAAFEAGVPVQLAHAVVTVESGWQPHVRGAAGEYGLMQIKCPTARAVGFTGNCGALADPSFNARFGTRYLRLALDRAGNDWARAASLYNRGVYAAPAVTAYSRLVMGAANRGGTSAGNAPVQAVLKFPGLARFNFWSAGSKPAPEAPFAQPIEGGS